MKKILQLLLVYVIIFIAVFTLYSNSTSKLQEQLKNTNSELKGVAYLTATFKLSITLALYQESLETDASKKEQIQLKTEMDQAIESIVQLYTLHSEFENDELSHQLKQLQDNTFDQNRYYDFLEYINHENYRIGDTSKLLFEQDRKMYFLSSLATHYMPEYLISLLIVHNKIEKFQVKGTLTPEDKTLLLEQNKLIQLSAEELKGIFQLLQAYPETDHLLALITNISQLLNKLNLIPENFDLWQNNKQDLQSYINITYELLSFSLELQDEQMRLLELNLNKRKDLLEKQILNNQISLYSLLILMGLAIYIFYKNHMSNITKDEEIKKINKTLDKMVYYSRTDPKGKIIHMSTALKELSGFTDDEVIGKTHRIFKHPDVPPEVFSDMWETISGKKIWQGELKNKTKSGDSYWTKLTITPDLNQNGEIIAYDAYREIVTDKKALEEEKNRTQKALEFKSQFLSNMSHEIRTPLNAIIGFTQLAHKTELTRDQSQLLQKVQSASEILLGIINNILDISKIESGKMQIEKTPFNLQELIQDTCNLLQQKAEEKTINLNCDCSNLMHVNVVGDPLKLSQILINLISNAIKFTTKGSVSVNVKELKDSSFKFEIVDTGIGLKKEQLETLFEEFVQADMSTSREYGGTGLGLAISKKLVALMGGDIQVQSTYKVGTSFSFILGLPKADPDQLVQSKERYDLKTLEEEIQKLHGKHILVAEDNKMNQLLVKMLLEESPLNLEFVKDGKQAVEKYKTGIYDLILMDIQMPKMNGYQATEAIRDIDTEIPIIALSANVMQEDVQKAKAFGMNEHLAKPIEIEKLYTLLLKYLA